eukprot:scaffold2754_cov388-Prasinococcus_capsulatus_cf.AAC.2
MRLPSPSCELLPHDVEYEPRIRLACGSLPSLAARTHLVDNAPSKQRVAGAGGETFGHTAWLYRKALPAYL